MNGAKLFSALPPEQQGRLHRGEGLLSRILNLKGKRRVRYHVLFWCGFVGFHLLYFLPALSSQQLDLNLQVSYTVHYARFIPVFYLSIAIFDRAKKRLGGIKLGLFMLMTLVLVMHLVTILTFFGLDLAYGLDELSPAFQVVGGRYLKAFEKGAAFDWLVLFFDIQELQLLILPVGIKMVQFGLRQQIAQIEQEKELLRNELAMLKSQLEPHFIYNVLSSAYLKVLPVSRSAASYLEKLSKLLRYTLYESNEDWVPLSNELRGLKRFMQLERLRLGARLSLVWRQQGTLKKGQLVPTLLLIMLGENAIKHGVRQRKEKTIVEIQIIIENEQITFSIENDKPPGATKDGKKTADGIGLKNIQRRLALLYPGQHQVQITQTESKYSVLLKMPLRIRP